MTNDQTTNWGLGFGHSLVIGTWSFGDWCLVIWSFERPVVIVAGRGAEGRDSCGDQQVSRCRAGENAINGAAFAGGCLPGASGFSEVCGETVEIDGAGGDESDLRSAGEA